MKGKQMLAHMGETMKKNHEQSLLKIASSIGVIEIYLNILSTEAPNDLLDSIKSAVHRIRQASAELRAISSN